MGRNHSGASKFLWVVALIGWGTASQASSRYDRGWMCRHSIYGRLLPHCGFGERLDPHRESLFAPRGYPRGSVAYVAKCGMNVFYHFARTQALYDAGDAVRLRSVERISAQKDAYAEELGARIADEVSRARALEAIETACRFDGFEPFTLTIEASLDCVERVVKRFVPGADLSEPRRMMDSYVKETNLAVEDELALDVLGLSGEDLARYENAVYRCHR